MLFNSYQFILVFLPISFFVYFWLNQARLSLVAKAWLVLCSLFFYSWWSLSYLPLILISMTVNYGLGQALNRPPQVWANVLSHKGLLVLGVALNLSALAYFKYANFLLDNLNAIGLHAEPVQLVLPLAISFFTFQQIAYLVDSYRKETTEYNFLNYMLFVTFFPQLIAGPIVHHKEMMPQFARTANLVKNYRHLTLGLCIFAIGLFKKVILADTFAGTANAGFDGGEPLFFFDAWATSLSYTFQLYFDFSGYTDMAIGIALLFNIKLPRNFNSPYKALSIQDFWRRWHITLSRFLRDYLYIPLGGSHNGTARTSINLFTTFLLGGLWHGASWMFVLWGALHGGALVGYRLWQRLPYSLPTWLAWLLTFNFINVTWVFFRAEDISSAARVLAGMVNLASINSLSLEHVASSKLAWSGSLFDGITWLPAGLLANGLSLLLIAVGFIIIAQANTQALSRTRLNVRNTMAAALLFAVAVVVTLAGASSVFLYFNF